MADDSDLAAVFEQTRSLSEKETLSPEEYQAIKRAVFGEVFQGILQAETSYFVLGRYDGDETEARLEAVTARLNDRDDAFAYLMKDVPEAWEFWPTKFRILAERADLIVPVLEDTDGSHEWEFGVVSGPEYRSKVHVLKREYPTEAEEHEHFDALPSQFVDVLDRDGRVTRWTTEAELLAALEHLPEA
ncbi:hypothetical protein L593_11795 [Salinarchaeum sp. Harcht-Bsk1]|uniref:hypothetical protein n=1 Tax=Salinarchaeum sp. Harcht-Bsk1 TaxID=1333523 RepID=UPI00034244E9|nr:hypothetical protein [Salinarchaeum sp. Harcht-Bsk1]AGN02302.1 hypothetical protein L593_11795 [Salinarchaeum sp. Harcht-Bsk1]